MDHHCVLFVVDALAFDIVKEQTRAGQLSNLDRLMQQGSLRECASIFPSITPAATCSIATGSYPRSHGIEGSCWMNQIANDVAYFGDDWRMLLQEGFKDYLVDFADRLNYERLLQPTIYEQLAAQGVESAAINFMWFRGPHTHKRSTPLELQLVATKLSSEVWGPKFLKLGDFVESMPSGCGDIPGERTGLTGRYGFHDETTAACVLEMARSKAFPAFTLAYFPLNDFAAHKHGLTYAAETRLANFDQFLGEFVEAIGGWSKLGQDYSMVIVGDHSQSQPRDSAESMGQIRLDEHLGDYTLADTAKGFQGEEEILICPNMRAAAIYQSIHCATTTERIIGTLLSLEGVDQVIVQDPSSESSGMITVKTADRGQMSFAASSDSDGERPTIDRYGNRWQIHGDTSCVDIELENHDSIVEGDYPNVLERIHGVFTGGPPPIWVTARPGFEFSIAETKPHQMGSHGSLHREDSVSALLATEGVDFDRLPSPQFPRIVDVMDLCLGTLNAKRLPLGEIEICRPDALIGG